MLDGQKVLITCLAASALTAAVVLAAACRSTTRRDAATPAASATPAATPGIVAAREITDANVVDLTLGAADFGPSFAAYLPARSTGPLTLADLEGDPCAVNQLDALKRLGFERGYNRDWVRPDHASRDLNLSVGSYVEIYPDIASAQGKFALDKRNVIEPLPAGCHLDAPGTAIFQVSLPVGDEAFGFRKSVGSTVGTPAMYTWVEFRRGRIIASADVIRDDGADTEAEAARLAQALDDHIVATLSSP